MNELLSPSGAGMQSILSRLDWSQAQLARRLEVSERTVYSWCKTNPPKSVMLYLELLDRVVNGG